MKAHHRGVGGRGVYQRHVHPGADHGGTREVRSVEAVLKIVVRNAERRYIDSTLRLVEEIKGNHPDLFQQVEVAIEY